MTETGAQTVVDGLRFPESPRWHDGALWFAEKRAGRVVRVDASGRPETVVEVRGGPGGIGWLPGGDLLVVSMADRQVLRTDGREPTVHADLADLTVGRCNDMVVDERGRAYVGDFGYDLGAGAPPAPASLVLVMPDGDARAVADDLHFPNGCVVISGGTTIVVAESAANRLTAFDVAGDGRLSGRRVFAELASVVPDGICLDAEGAIWVADPLGCQVVRVTEGGDVLERLSTGSEGAFACVLGGADGTTLYVCTYTEEASMDPSGPAVGRVVAFDVGVPSGGSP